MSDWQPIATAPKDGTLLLLVEDGDPLGYEIPYFYVGYWASSHRYKDGGFWQQVYRDLVGTPTHWHRLPFQELPR